MSTKHAGNLGRCFLARRRGLSALDIDKKLLKDNKREVRALFVMVFAIGLNYRFSGVYESIC